MMNARRLEAAIAVTAAAWSIAHIASPAVRSWRPSQLPARRAGPLHTRSGGHGETVIILLHGLVANGDIFGADFDALAEHHGHRVVVPDLLGFGRSRDDDRSTFTAADHLDALDELLRDLGLDNRPLILAGHSMGAAVAVQWAARRGDQVQRLVGWGSPIYRDEHHLAATIAASSPMARLFVAQTAWAQRACHLSCRNRKLSGWVAAAASPSLPVAISRGASAHSWPAYRDAMHDIVADTDWESDARTVVEAGTDVCFAWGADDPIGDPGLAATFFATEVVMVDGADHHLPLTHAELCLDHITGT